MNARHWNRWLGCLALGALGCGDTIIIVQNADAGTRVTVDTGAAIDSGAATDTGGATERDVGTTPPTDTGTTTPIDAGTAPVDAGTTPIDAGTAPADVGELPRFSFFVTSLRALQELSGNSQGFGGDLRYGETGPGAGLRGADRICAAIAERSMPGSSRKQWRAFLSVTNGGAGTPVHAIDRIGAGPWYDRLGRLFGNNLTEITAIRPTTANAAIRNDFPNEDGVPNHRPDPTAGQVDNHDMLTGSNTSGRLYGNTATCLDWTSALGNRTTEGRPRVGHSWPRNTGGGGGMGGSMDHWMSSLDEAGCAPGVSLIEMGGPILSMPTVGSGGGYGGFYCFALTP